MLVILLLMVTTCHRSVAMDDVAETDRFANIATPPIFEGFDFSSRSGDLQDWAVKTHPPARNPRMNSGQFAKDFVTKNNLQNEPLPMNEVLNDITDLYDKLPKPLQVVAAPNFGSLIKTMHSIKRELDKMHLRTTRTLEPPTTTRPEVRVVSLTPSWKDNARISNGNSISLENVEANVVESREKLKSMIGPSVRLDHTDIQRRLDDEPFLPSKQIPLNPAHNDTSDAILYSNQPISDEQYINQKLNAIKTLFEPPKPRTPAPHYWSTRPITSTPPNIDRLTKINRLKHLKESNFMNQTGIPKKLMAKLKAQDSKFQPSVRSLKVIPRPSVRRDQYQMMGSESRQKYSDLQAQSRSVNPSIVANVGASFTVNEPPATSSSQSPSEVFTPGIVQDTRLDRVRSQRLETTSVPTATTTTPGDEEKRRKKLKQMSRWKERMKSMKRRRTDLSERKTDFELTRTVKQKNRRSHTHHPGGGGGGPEPNWMMKQLNRGFRAIVDTFSPISSGLSLISKYLPFSS